MRAFDQGAFIRVTVTWQEVWYFAKRWPCFGSVRPMSFTFQRSNGDLVDIGNDRGMDGSGVAAMADDCKAYASKRLKLDWFIGSKPQ